MKLKRVEIKGFKSIARKTSLPLADGITCIAGPNGCGKSNIIDAVRWALGEQSNRSLRAGTMSEVIFSGTQDAGPASMAEVTLEFAREGGFFPQSLEGFDEVAVSRRLYTTGESVYSINGVRCRLKDVTDIFLDTGLDRHGYAIVEQGKVKDVIQSKPEDIRYLIEEAAEVGKFRIKRTDAMKRLEATAANLERIEDLLGEVSRQRDELKAQANKARRYQLVRDEINGLTRLLWAHEIEAITGRKAGLELGLREIEARMESIRKAHDEYVNALKAHEYKLSVLRQKKDETAAALSEAHSKMLLAEKEIEAVGRRRQDLSETFDLLAARIEQMGKAAEELAARKEREAGDLEKLGQEISALAREMAARTERAGLLGKELAGAEGEYGQARTKLFDAIGHVRAYEQRISSLEARRQEAISNREKRGEDRAGLEGRKKALQEKLDGYDREIALKRSGKEGLEASIAVLDGKLRAAQAGIEKLSPELSGLEKTLARTQAKILMLERIIASSTRPIPPDLTRLNGATRVADALRVKPGYETIVGRSLGSALDYLIVRDHREILDTEGIEEAGPGLIPRTPHVEEPREGVSFSGPGVVAPLRDFINAREGYGDVVDALSRNMLVVEDMRSAMALWARGERACSLVTRDGAILEPSGVVRNTREMEKYAEGLKAKAEKEEAGKQAAALEREIAGVTERLAGLKEEHQAAVRELGSARDRDRDLKAELDGLVDGRHLEAREMERLQEREQSFERDIRMWEEMAQKISADLALISAEKETLDEGIAAMQDGIRALDEKRLAVKEAHDSAQAAVEEHKVRMGELNVTAAARRERIQGLESQLGHIDREMASDRERREELRGTKDAVLEALEKANGECARARGEVERREESLKALLPEYDDLSDMLSSLSQSRDECRETLNLLEKEKNENVLARKGQEIAFSMSMERFGSRFAQEAVPEIPEGFDPEEARDRAAKAEARIEKMGQINFASLEAYDQVQARWDDLHRQYEDVVQASTRLREVIASIEGQSLKAFTKTFEEIRTHFQELFAIMFGGGKADRILTEGSPLEAGVEILACPPFKKLKTMSLLSEGEKTLCALSFIFALFKVKPSPFCILDEVDAPLDDANVIRFNRLIRAFSNDSQFIMVTHNRYTMEMADILYGVTFDVPGVSKVVSMALQESA